MTRHSSASMRDEAPHVTNSTKTNTISDAIKRRAQSVINDRSIDAQSRAVIRYGLETNDPWLDELVRRVDAGESLSDGMSLADTIEEKIDALSEMICRAGDQSAAALLVLMATLENSTHPKALANQAKHLAFTHCASLNLHGMVDAQVAVLESELLASNALAS